MKFLKSLFLASVFTLSVFGQTTDETYSLSAELGLGYSRYVTTMKYDDLNKSGFSGTVRVMWNPEHLLSIGLETGYQQLYSIDVSNYETEFGTTEFSASMYTIPIFIVFAMRITPNIKLTAGGGTNLLFNEGNMFNDPLESSQISIGAHIGVSYTIPISSTISIGGELLYSYYSKIQDQTFAIQFIFVYNFLEW